MSSIQMVIAQLVVYCVVDKQSGKTEGNFWCKIEGRPPDSQDCTGKRKGAADSFLLRNTREYFNPSGWVPSVASASINIKWLPQRQHKAGEHIYVISASWVSLGSSWTWNLWPTSCWVLHSLLVGTDLLFPQENLLPQPQWNLLQAFLDDIFDWLCQFSKLGDDEVRRSGTSGPNLPRILPKYFISNCFYLLVFLFVCLYFAYYQLLK